MACELCWTVPQPLKKHSYFVQMSNDAGESFDCVVQTECIHDLQEWVDEHASEFPISNPKVINVDAKRAAHIPIMDSVKD